MKKNKYTAKIVKITAHHILNATGQIVEVSYHDATLDYFNGTGKYTWIELYTILKTITSNTLRDLGEQGIQYSYENNDWDIHLMQA